MAFGAQLPIRLDPEVEQKLQTIAGLVGITKSALLRQLAKTFVEQMTEADGSVRLPPDWHAVLGGLPAADGRSRRLARAGRPPGARPAPAAPLPNSAPDAAAVKLLKRHVPSARERGTK